jgi:hypothetical protein
MCFAIPLVAFIALWGAINARGEDSEPDLRGEITELKKLNAQITERLEQLEAKLNRNDIRREGIDGTFSTWMDLFRPCGRPALFERDAIPRERPIFTPEEMRELLDEWERIWFSDGPDNPRASESHGGVI